MILTFYIIFISNIIQVLENIIPEFLDKILSNNVSNELDHSYFLL